MVVLQKTDSTNDQAWREALEGAPDGTVVVAEEQTCGRGRFGRSWFGAPGRAIALSVVLRSGLAPERLGLVTAAGAVATAEAVERTCGVRTKIRFPNDVMAGERKIAGVLAETRFVSGNPDLCVLGIGINVNVREEEFPKELRSDATSVLMERGKPAERNRIVRALLTCLEEYLGSAEEVVRAWGARSYLLGRRVELIEAGKKVRGLVEGEDLGVGLALRLENGLVRQVRGEYIEKVRALPNSRIPS